MPARHTRTLAGMEKKFENQNIIFVLYICMKVYRGTALHVRLDNRRRLVYHNTHNIIIIIVMKSSPKCDFGFLVGFRQR